MASPYGEDIAVLKDQMKEVKATLERIETKLDAGAAVYATKSELRAFKWVTVPLIIILTAVLTALVAYFFDHQTQKNAPTTTTTVSNSTGSTSTTKDTPQTESAGVLDNVKKQVGL